MSISPPEFRQCSSCSRILNLNLFRADSLCCRYCETGKVAPSNSNGPSLLDRDIGKASQVVKLQEKKVITPDKINNNSANNPRDDSIELSAIFGMDQEWGEENSLIYKKAALTIFSHFIHEINIFLGCKSRWNIDNGELDKLVKWILAKEYTQKKIEQDLIPSELILNNYLTIIINKSLTNVTFIKASIRTLLNSPKKRRLKLYEFLVSLMNGTADEQKALEVLEADLLNDTNELGYAIPIIPLPSESELLEINSPLRIIYFISYFECVKQLSIQLNSGHYQVHKAKLDGEVIESSLDSFRKLNIKVNDIDLNNSIQSGLKMGYKLFGLSKENENIYYDSGNILIINLKGSKKA